MVALLAHATAFHAHVPGFNDNTHTSRAKVLLFDGTGLCIYMKRLDKGRFAKLWKSDGGALSLTMSELSLFLEGSELVGKRALSPAPITHAELAPRIVL